MTMTIVTRGAKEKSKVCTPKFGVTVMVNGADMIGKGSILLGG